MLEGSQSWGTWAGLEDQYSIWMSPGKAVYWEGTLGMQVKRWKAQSVREEKEFSFLTKAHQERGGAAGSVRVDSALQCEETALRAGIH